MWPSWPQACIFPATSERHAGDPGLGDGQRVHVGAERDPRAVAAADDADHAGPADAGRDLVDAEAPEQLRHRRCRTVLLVGKLGLAMEGTPPGGHLGQARLDLVGDGHVRAMHLLGRESLARISRVAARRPSLFVKRRVGACTRGMTRPAHVDPAGR